MAQYEAQCSAVGSFAYSNYFKLYVILSDGDVSGNASKVNYNVYCQSSGSGSIDATHWKYFNLNGQEIYNVTENIDVSSPNAYIHIASGTTDWIEHNSDGSKSISFSAQIKANSYGVSASLEGTFDLVSIPRYASFNGHRINATYLTSVEIAYNSDKSLVAAESSLNGGSWQPLTIKSGNWNAANNTVIYTIGNLEPNSSYTIRTRIAHVSGLWTYSDTLIFISKDIARISGLEDFEHGSNPIVSITNPAIISSLSLVMKIGDTQILSRTVSTGSNTITFSDTELDNLYKKYGSSNSLIATFVLSGGGYTNSKTCTVTLKGNQKTIRTNVNSSWKRGKLWTNVNGTWERGVLWTNVSGTWERGI